VKKIRRSSGLDPCFNISIPPQAPFPSTPSSTLETRGLKTEWYASNKSRSQMIKSGGFYKFGRGGGTGAAKLIIRSKRTAIRLLTGGYLTETGDPRRNCLLSGGDFLRGIDRGGPNRGLVGKGPCGQGRWVVAHSKGGRGWETRRLA